MKKLVVGILAHVDAGKTTLSEGLAYLCGNIRRLGRVDHGDAYLDTQDLERERGITIFSKQAVLSYGETQIFLLDTPGHVDFSAEMERTLQVLDYAVLLISGSDGVQGHTLTVWKLLERYHVPVILFFNKMDQEGARADALLAEAQKRLSSDCQDFTQAGLYYMDRDGRPDHEDESVLEGIAMYHEALLDRYLQTGDIPLQAMVDLIGERKLFPCFFGSALKMEGVKEFLDAFVLFTREPARHPEFGARVFKISRDEQGNRLTYMKITGGRLEVKELLSGEKDGERWEEKIDQIRIISGMKSELIKEAQAGMSVAVTGLSHTWPGEGLGCEDSPLLPVLEPVLDYQLLSPSDYEITRMLRNMRELEEEDPQLHVSWREKSREIHMMLMGEVQTEILKRVIWDRYHAAVDFGTGRVIFKETIAAPVIGVGHFEPLRHYAEVHLLLEPTERGSGLNFFTALSEDVLDRNWQRLILTHLMEREHPGVLTGSSITDMQITLINGRAHIKHTEGGDFRQATYRAVRNGLKKAQSILLEPYYEYSIELPSSLVGRVMTDIQRMGGSFDTPLTQQETTVISGRAPVREMAAYPKELVSFTGGRGRISLSLGGYFPCRDQETQVEETGYDAERDMDNPTGSVFCAHGAGFIVPWDEVENYMHLSDSVFLPGSEPDHTESREQEPVLAEPSQTGRKSRALQTAWGSYEEERELQAMIEKTFGPVRTRLRRDSSPTVIQAKDYAKAEEEKRRYTSKSTPVYEDEYLLVDGYNMIFAWPDLKKLARENIYSATGRLMDLLCNYQGLTGVNLILVFDAYKLKGHQEEVIRYHNIHVVYTREAETADMYIEKTVHKLGRNNKVTVATSDGLEQVIILGQGAIRMSAEGLYKELHHVLDRLRTDLSETPRVNARTYLLDHAQGEVAQWLDRVRQGQ
ncbi:MAG: TetM/TetW/TetO/TetS family tetracycline resistance ribosomal protection protein [Blautia sp.]|nr:TetM/TetW/TetO/TetS family tetracycline resistance ribosomal protection protein [Blautia sp.]